MKRLRNTDRFYAPLFLALLVAIWQVVVQTGLVPAYMLPSPLQVVRALVKDFGLILDHSGVTLLEAAIGLFFGVLLGFIFALIMDMFSKVYKALYPIIIFSQTIPTVAIAPLLVLWFGYEMTPKVILIVIVTFFPITMGLLEGFKSVDKDQINLLRSMGASEVQLFRFTKLPNALPHFFSGLKISAAYSVVGAVIAEWLGGFKGLGVYMIRVKKSFSFDKMFAIIIVISLLSLLLMKAINYLQKKMTPWEGVDRRKIE